MKQVFMDVKTGSPLLLNVPAPGCKKGGLLVETLYSAVSAGTERSLIDFGKKGLLAKIRERPDQAKKVIDKIRTDGALAAISAAFSKLGEPLPLGYSMVGKVIEVGSNSPEFSPGDFVACAGGTASHAEVVYVPKNLAVKVPEHFKDLRQAAFVALGAIAMHGVRQAQVTLGDWVAVIGMGLVGQLTARILHASGCHVIGIDIDGLAGTDAGAYLSAFIKADDDSAEGKIKAITGKGCDAVVITAATTSNQPVELASALCRDRATISMVGVTGMDIPRRPFYEKELTFRLSRSYGPGRYDTSYEENGIDYPIGYVKWTEKRNMEEFINLLYQGSISISNLITHEFEIEKATDAYSLITENPNKERYLGVLLGYPIRPEKTERTVTLHKEKEKVEGKIGVGIIGAGNFVRSTMLPNMSKIPDFELIALATSGSSSSGQATKKHNFRYATTDYKELLNDPDIDLIVIATPHNTHAPLAVEALNSGKHVYVEKPLAITIEQLEDVKAAYEHNNQHLFVGFNRRYSPFAKFLKDNLESDKYSCMIQYTVNAGTVPEDHWIQDPEVGGGRIIGEVCHFIDFCLYLTGSTPKSTKTTILCEPNKKGCSDNVNITIEFDNGSVANILYTSVGSKKYQKESVTVFCNGKVGRLDNYKKAEIFSEKGNKKYRKMNQEKGFEEEYFHIGNTLRTGENTKKTDSFQVIYIITQSAIEVKNG